MAKFYIKGPSVYISGTLNEPVVSLWYNEGLIEKQARSRTLFVGPISNIHRMLALAPQIKNEAILEAAQKELERSVATEELIRYGVDEDDPEVKSLGLWPHQVLGVRLARINKRFGFWFDTRTGKTRMMIRAMYEALESGKCQRALVICPTAIIPSWLGDFEDYMPELKVAAYYGTDKQKREALNTPCHVFIISMELVVRNMELLRQIGFNYVVVDESSKLKSHKSQISKTLLEYAQEVEYWYLLSATPAPNNESEYYVQMRTIDQFIFPPTYTRFAEKYFRNVSRSPMYMKLVMRTDMKQEFTDLVATKSIYIDQSIMPTAGKEWKIVSYPLDSRLLAAYEEFRKNAVIELSSGERISTDMIAAVNAKLSQITSGFIIDTDAVKENKMRRKLHDTTTPPLQEFYRLESDYSPSQKAHELQKLLDMFGDQQVVIWANYRQEFIDIKELLGSKCRILNSTTTTVDKLEYIKQFKAHKIQYLVCHPLSVGMGINLTEAHKIVYYSLSYSYEALKQSSERTCGHIKVQPNKCTYYVLCAENTIDAAIYKNVSDKKTSSLDFMNALKKGG